MKNSRKAVRVTARRGHKVNPSINYISRGGEAISPTTLHGGEAIGVGTLHGGEAISPTVFHGGEAIGKGTLH